MKLSKRKSEWREQEYKDCKYQPLENGQEFIGGRKIVLWYPSNKIADGGFVDAEWSQRIEIHHLIDECKTYYDERPHDAIYFQMGEALKIYSMKVQRDGAVQIVVGDDFKYENWQAAELRKI